MTCDASTRKIHYVCDTQFRLRFQRSYVGRRTGFGDCLRDHHGCCFHSGPFATRPRRGSFGRIDIQREPKGRRASVVPGHPEFGGSSSYSVEVGPPKTGFLGSTCDFTPVGMSVNSDDASPLFVEISVNDYGSMYGTLNKDDHKLSGIGSKAYWDSQAPGMDAPQVVAEKGKIDCMVTTNGEVDHTTLPYTISVAIPW